MTWITLCAFHKGYENQEQCPQCASDLEEAKQNCARLVIRAEAAEAELAEVARILSIRDIQSESRGNAVLALLRQLDEATNRAESAEQRNEALRAAVSGITMAFDSVQAQRDELAAALEEISGEYGDCATDDELFDATHNQDFGDHCRFAQRVITRARAALERVMKP